MKKFAIALIALCLTAGMILPTSAAGTYIRGDADGDGDVSVIDATAILRKLADIPIPYIDMRAADVDGSGLDATDATRIQRYLAGMRNDCRIGETFAIPDPTVPPLPTDEYEIPILI